MEIKHSSIRISTTEYSARCTALLTHIRTKQLSGVVLFDRDYILYYAGFAFIPTERPIAFLMNAKGEKALFVPRLELEHAQANALIDRVEHYTEYPDKPHPMKKLKVTLVNMGITKDLGADHDGYPWIFGYRGPSISELTGARVRQVTAFVEDQMMIKSPAEIALMRESVRWGNLAHMLLQRYTKVGLTETDVSLRASMDANIAMLDAIGPLYRSQNAFSDGASAGYRGQIGRNSAIPHALANNVVFQPGDVLVTGATAPMWGYVSELERTMIIGHPSQDHHHMFEHMLAVQNLAFSLIRPGVKCSDVDRGVRGYYEDNNLQSYWRHHVGHGIGLRYHEAPFMDIGDMTELKPGMVLTVEPGLYVPGLGGFRHSDTIVIVEDGIEILTYYPRDLSSLTIMAN